MRCRPAWADRRNRPRHKQSVPLPDPSWEWVAAWAVEVVALSGSDAELTDDDGWQYAFSWSSKYSAALGSKHFVRRRLWTRTRRRRNPAEAEEPAAGAHPPPK
eukprot:SAG22_NODE_441_length_10481_cov_3.790695_2_plen_103_part_00